MSINSTRPGNSNSNAKQSFNSQSSDNIDSKGINKKRKISQKTLGVAWGANSLSSSRSSFRSAPFSDFGSYMAVKNKKLQDQFDAEASSSSHSGSESAKPIFQGVSIFVDGFTIPSSQELRGYMLKHGGRFENYFSRRHVTHIICSNLPNSKLKNLRSFSGGLPVVKPTWVLDCVAARKLLSWVPYQLDQLTNKAGNQPKLSAFFALRSSSISQDVSSDSTCLLKAEAEDSELRGPVLNDNTSFNADESSECAKRSEIEMKDVGWKQIDAAGVVDDNTFLNVVESSEYDRKYETEMKDACCEQIDTADDVGQVSEDKEISFLDFGKSVDANSVLKSSPNSPSTSACCHDLHTKAAGESTGSQSLVGRPSYHCHSTSEDPNFVENYFKSSRLHFIGTWRNRYHKRIASSSSKIKQTHSDVNAASQKATIVHIDMDCFFVAVVIRNRPELLDKPVAVCHSDSRRGTAEISSANYPARSYGVKAGMFVRDAKARCPHLLIVPYNFEAYEEVAHQFYSILHKYCNKVQAVSCDEAFLEVTDSDEKDPELLASKIRKDIFETTGCTASAGIAGNLLMARLATRTAKPDGQCYIPLEKVDEYLVQLPIKNLPSIGHVLEEKLKKKGVQICDQLRMFSKEALQRDFGVKTGEMLWNYCRGLDNRSVEVIQETKSVGAEVNWGVRFKDIKDSQHFLSSLCKEVSIRLQGCEVQGRRFTLKIKKRRKDAEEPAKYMGCGDCENLSHSTTVPLATDDVDILQRIAMQLFGLFHIDIKDIRGIGLQVTKLESADNTKQGHEKNTLRSWLASSTAGATERCNSYDTGQSYHEPCRPSLMISDPSSHQSSCNLVAAFPSLEDLDMGVIESLPPELFSEINDMYGGKLIDLISKSKGKASNKSVCATSVKEVEGNILTKQEAHASSSGQINRIQEEEACCCRDKAMKAGPAFGTGKAVVISPLVELENVALMPSSLSQVDTSVLQQLPEELRADIVGALPAHRSSNSLPGSGSISIEALEMRVAEDPVRFMKSAEDTNLWVGSPPYWVCKFKASNCLMLNILADMYLKSGFISLLSSTLQCCLSGYRIFSDVTEDVANEASNSLCQLLRQYIQLKLETDIEEIYVCFCLLKRLTFKSKAFSCVYDIVLPHLQASVGESYGGNLHLSPVR